MKVKLRKTLLSFEIPVTITHLQFILNFAF